MKDISVTQEYMICALNKRKKLSSSDQRTVVCLIAGGLLEMQLEKCVSIKDKAIEVCGELPQHMEYLRPLYDELNKGKPVKAEKVIEAYAVSITDKKLKELKASLMKSLNENGVLEAAKGGVFQNKDIMLPTKDAVTGIVEKLRAELLEDGRVSEEAVALTVLMDKSGYLSEYFSKFEQKELRGRMANIRNGAAGTLVKEIVEYVDGLMAAMLICCIIPNCF